MKRYLIEQSKGKTVNFDVNGTLIHQTKDKPRAQTVKLLKQYKDAGAKLTVWSRKGKEYANNVGKRLGLKGVKYASKNTPHEKPDISVDDMEHNLGKHNVDATKI